jgi:PAS domain S-box-containing protein/TyrR family helix-turn-helix protein
MIKKDGNVIGFTIDENLIDLESVLTSLFDIVHVTDVNGKTIYCSDNYENFFGISSKEMIGKNIEDFFNLGYFQPTITGKVIQTQKKVHTIQTTFNARKLFVIGTPVFDKHGQFKGVVNTSTDITHKEKVQNELSEIKKLGTLYFEEIVNLSKDKEEESTPLIYRSQTMRQIVQMTEKVANFDSSVILLGESGVGKGVLAKFIHDNSPRENKNFVHINCGAIPESLIESELFGYEKGAFTGANKEGKIGLIEKANGGTLFLDEIGELPLNLQVKLLTVLQEKELTRVGGSVQKKIDIRLITATNKNLKEMITKGEFREDLYYRIHVVPIMIPPLRERKDDISILVRYFLNYFSQKYLLNKKLSEKCYQIFEQYNWPGNVRELENLIERLIVTSNGEIITSEHIPVNIFDSTRGKTNGLEVYTLMQIPKAFEEVEKQLLQKAYDQYKTTTKIAEALGISQPSVSRKLRKYSIHQ